jgi:hypothetical protein
MSLSFKSALMLLIMLSLIVTLSDASHAFRVPYQNGEEGLRAQVKSQEDTINAQRISLIIALVALVASITANVLLVMTIWRTQKQVSESLDAIRNVNLLKETAVKFSAASTRSTDEIARRFHDKDPDKDTDGDDIEIVRSGF